MQFLKSQRNNFTSMHTRACLAVVVLGLGSGAVHSGSALAQTVVPGLTIETYATVTDPVDLAFDSATGNLYTGGDLSGSGGSPLDFAPIHRVGPGGSPVVQFGSLMSDPDAVIFDGPGTFSGIPGSVLVGGSLGNSQAIVYAVAPDETTTQLWGPTLAFRNPGHFEYDSTGRLLISDPTAQKILVSTGGFPTMLISTGYPVSVIAIDATDQIYTRSSSDGNIRIYDNLGALVDNAFVTGFDPSGGAGTLEFGPGACGWGNDLFAIANGDLHRIDEFGNSTIIGTGFFG